MGVELIRQVDVKPDGVYLYSKSDNDGLPFHLWRSDGLTKTYQSEGQRGLDREIVRMLCEYANIQGGDSSVERYIPCLTAEGHFRAAFVDKVNAAYAKLTPEDIATNRFLSGEKQTSAMRTYQQFESKERNSYYTQLAGFAKPLEYVFERNLSRGKEKSEAYKMQKPQQKPASKQPPTLLGEVREAAQEVEARKAAYTAPDKTTKKEFDSL